MTIPTAADTRAVFAATGGDGATVYLDKTTVVFMVVVKIATIVRSLCIGTANAGAVFVALGSDLATMDGESSGISTSMATDACRF